MTDVKEFKAETPSLGDEEHSHRQNAHQKETSQRPSTDAKTYNMKYGPEGVVSLLIPVAICMMMVVAIKTNVTFKSPNNIAASPLKEDNQGVLSNLWSAIRNALVLVGVIILTSLMLLFCYVYKFYKVLTTYLLLSNFVVIYLYTFLLFRDILPTYNISMDYITLILFHWNFAAPAILCIFWKGPSTLQRAYLVFITARSALIMIKYLPNWTTWIFLICLSIWDIIAVLSPRGPLKILVETADKRNEPIFPALVYSTVAYSAVTRIDPTESSSPSNESYESEQYEETDDNHTTTTESPTTIPTKVKSSNRPRRRRRRRRKSKLVKESVQLGLGDFLTFGILAGKSTSPGDWNVTFACFVAISTGLGFTILLLTTTRKVLPALPISVAFGMIFYFFTSEMVRPFFDVLLTKQIFV